MITSSSDDGNLYCDSCDFDDLHDEFFDFQKILHAGYQDHVVSSICIKIPRKGTFSANYGQSSWFCKLLGALRWVNDELQAKEVA